MVKRKRTDRDKGVGDYGIVKRITNITNRYGENAIPLLLFHNNYSVMFYDI